MSAAFFNRVFGTDYFKIRENLVLLMARVHNYLQFTALIAQSLRKGIQLWSALLSQPIILQNLLDICAQFSTVTSATKHFQGIFSVI